jgi:outer membrane receptor protein involved in Fe transport
MSRFFPLASVYTFSSAALLSPLSETAFAQETNSQIIEEVTVTALKRETLLQETPISLLAVSGLDLAERQIDSVAELLRASPGLTVLDQGPGQRRLVSRGIQSAGEAQVGLYYDEAPLGGGAPSTTNDAGLRMPEVPVRRRSHRSAARSAGNAVRRWINGGNGARDLQQAIAAVRSSR